MHTSIGLFKDDANFVKRVLLHQKQVFLHECFSSFGLADYLKDVEKSLNSLEFVWEVD